MKGRKRLTDLWLIYSKNIPVLRKSFVAAKVINVVISPKEGIKIIRLTDPPLQGLNGRICQISPSSFSIDAMVTVVKAIASSTLLAM